LKDLQHISPKDLDGMTLSELLGKDYAKLTSNQKRVLEQAYLMLHTKK
jgi:hypothetical protein